MIIDYRCQEFQKLIWINHSFKNAKMLQEINLYLPKEILSDVASLFNQNETHEITTSRTHGPYTCITKFPMCRWRWKLTISVECSPKIRKEISNNFTFITIQHHYLELFLPHWKNCKNQLQHFFCLGKISNIEL